MKNLILKTIVIALLWCNVNGQTKNVSIKYGDKDLKTQIGNILTVDGNTNTGYFIVGRSEDGLIIEKYDTNLRQVDTIFWSNSNKATNSKPVDVKVIFLKDKILLFRSLFNKENKTHELYCQVIDKSDFKRSGNEKAVASYQNAKSESGYGFNTLVSPDLTKLAVFTTKIAKDDEAGIVSTTVYNSELNLLWEKKTPTLDHFYEYGGGFLDNQGNVFLRMVTYNEGWTHIKDKKPNSYYKLYCFTDNGNNAQNYKIEEKDKFFRGMRFKPNGKGEVICVGVYFNDYLYKYVSGIFSCKIDLNKNKLSPITFNSFSNEFIMEGLGKRATGDMKKLEDNQKGIGSLVIKQLHIFPDGSSVVISQVESSSIDNSQVDEVFFGWQGGVRREIVLMSLDATGKEIWKAKILKDQGASDDQRWLSYMSVNLYDSLILLYNDHRDNLDLKPGDEIISYSSGAPSNKIAFGATKKSSKVVCKLVITPNGVVSKEEAFPAEPDLGEIRINRSKQFDPNHLFLLTDKSIAIVTYNNVTKKIDLVNGYGEKKE